MHHILFYEYVKDMAERRGPYREAHLARIHSERDAGRIVMAGALGNPQPDDGAEPHAGEAADRAGFKPTGAAIVFVDIPREAIEEFARTDPYVEAGLVPGWRIEPWNLV